MTPDGRRGRARAGAALCALAVASVLAAAAWGAGGAGAAHGQEEGAGGIRAPLPEARIPSVSVTVLGNGTALVEHKVASGGGGGGPMRVPLVAGEGGGRPVDVRAVGGDGIDIGAIEVSDDGSHAVVPAGIGGGGLLVRYGLEDAMRLSEPSTYSWSFLYRATTSFALPDGVDVAFVNGQAVHFAGAKAFTCHGCQMELEFTVDEPRGVQAFELGPGGERIDVGVWTAAEVGPLAFDPASMSIAYEAGGVSDTGGRWVTLVVPTGLIGPPYRAEVNGENAPVTTFDAGGGRVGVSVRPAEDRTVRIFGSTAAGTGAGGEREGGEEPGQVAAAGKGGGDSSRAPPDRGGGAADLWIWAAAAGIGAGGAAAAAYLALVRRRRRRGS